MLLKSIHHNLNELIDLLHQLSDKEYSKPYSSLSGATIGEHTRHILELFQCLEKSYYSGTLNYDNRERNHRIQSDAKFAMLCIEEIKQGLKSDNKTIYLHQEIDGLGFNIQSNYYRELVYNLDHCVHHQALIKVAILECENVFIDENFGVARSTIQHRKVCAR